MGSCAIKRRIVIPDGGNLSSDKAKDPMSETGPTWDVPMGMSTISLTQYQRFPQSRHYIIVDMVFAAKAIKRPTAK